MPVDLTAAHVFSEADVYASFDLAVVVPVTEAAVFAAGWNIIGLLDGDTGFATSRSEDVNDSFAWGGILMRRTRKNHVTTKSFTCFERNATVNRLTWPGSTTTTVSIPKIEPVKIAFELRDGDFIQRWISVNYAEVEVDGDITENENDVSSISFKATIFPNALGELFTVQPALDYLAP